MKTFTRLFLICAALLVAAPSAYAVDSTESGYGGVGGNTQADIEPGGGVGAETTTTVEPQANTAPEPPSLSPTSPQETTKSDSLPFTGLDLGLLTLAGLIVLLAGIGLRRLTRSGRSLA